MEILLFLILIALGFGVLTLSMVAERIDESNKAFRQISYQLSRFHPKEEVSDETKVTFNYVNNKE